MFFSTHLIPADHFVSDGLLLWQESILAVGDLEDELLDVLYFDILGSCSTDLSSSVGRCDCSKHKYFPAQRLGEDVADVERFPSLAAGMKDRSLLLPSTLKDKDCCLSSCLRTGYSVLSPLQAMDVLKLLASVHAGGCRSEIKASLCTFPYPS